MTTALTRNSIPWTRLACQPALIGLIMTPRLPRTGQHRMITMSLLKRPA